MANVTRVDPPQASATAFMPVATPTRDEVDILAAIAALDPQARGRVVRYVVSRWGGSDD